jgi:hypothetical protein
MPTQAAKKRATTKKKQGKSSSSQAGEYVREEMRELKKKKGKGGRGSPKSRKQAIAIGLSEARQAGVRVPKKKSSKKK